MLSENISRVLVLCMFCVKKIVVEYYCNDIVLGNEMKIKGCGFKLSLSNRFWLGLKIVNI